MKIEKEHVDIIIPTMDNLKYLIPCCSSIIAMRQSHPVRLIIVNNGKIPLEPSFPDAPQDIVKIINPGKNLGWTGGLAEGLKHSDAKYVMFCNDDILIPISSYRWLTQLTRHLVIWDDIGAIGPASNCVMGPQNIFSNHKRFAIMTTFLVGFCMLIRRSTLDEVGGIDTDFPTGDDIDLSIRLHKAGYYLVSDSSVFVYHHGFKTGETVYGKPHKAGGWNSKEMTEETNKKLIQKHGFKAWWLTMCRPLNDGWYKDTNDEVHKKMNKGKHSETEVVVSFLPEAYDGLYHGDAPKDILELGCGGAKTIDGSLGIDIVSKGTPIPFTGLKCEADIQADIQDPFPVNGDRFKYIIARHVLEHCVDVVSVLNNCKGALKDDGKLIISVPDERVCDSILINGDHVHAFTPESLGKIVKNTGYKVNKVSEFYGSDSFTMELQDES